VDKQVYWWFQVENMHGKAHLSMDVATESEVADTEGSTATTCRLEVGKGRGWNEVRRGQSWVREGSYHPWCGGNWALGGLQTGVGGGGGTQQVGEGGAGGGE
jgi:hypothetical protein